MFYQSREETMEGIAAKGSASCCYMPGHTDVEAWKAGAMCDCKYGVRRDTRPGGEETGCPELRSVYKILSIMDDYEWNEMVGRAGGIQSRFLFREVVLDAEDADIDKDDQMGVWL